MADLVQIDTDEEMDKYAEAELIASNPPPVSLLKNKKLSFNSTTRRNDVLASLSTGGYVKIGEEDISKEDQVRQYSRELQGMDMPFDVADFEAAGFTAQEVEAAGVMPVEQEKTERTEPLREGEQLRILREGGDAAIAAPSRMFMRDDWNRGTVDVLSAIGVPAQQANQIADLVMGQVDTSGGTGIFDSGVGIIDFTPVGLAFGIEEIGDQLNRSIQADDKIGIGTGMLFMALSAAEAYPLTKAGAKAVKAQIPAIRQAIADLGQSAEERIAQEGTTLFSNPVGPAVDRGLAAAGRLVAPKLEDGLPGRISTRLPTAKAATEDPMTGELIVGLEEMKTEPALYEFNVNITKDYPNMQAVEGESVDETAERFIEHVKDNLLYIHDKVPADTRVRSQKWYDGARAITDRWSEEYGVPDTSIAGALAALSPQKDWYQNVSLAQRVLDVAIKQKDFTFADEMEQTFRALPSLNKPKYEPMLEAIKGKSYTEIVDEDPAVQATLRALFVRLYDQTYNKPDYQIVGPEGDMLDFATTASGARKKAAWGSLNEIGKAVASIDVNGDVNTISRLMGERHKVRNFYNNIYDPNSPFGDVTIDTHAVAAGLLRPLSGNSLEVDHNFKNMSVKGRGTTKGSAKSGVSGNYGLYAEAYRRAAAERGILPRQMQSITWEAVRGLFTDKFKQSAKNVADIDAIWQRYKDGEIDLDETRRLVDERAGGINPPSWE
jgi:hypothetical protein